MVIIKYSEGQVDKVIEKTEENSDDLENRLNEAYEENDKIKKNASNKPFWVKK